MAVISLPPTHVSLFAPPPMPRWLDAVLFPYASILAGIFGFLAKQFAWIAFTHMTDPHANAGMAVAGVCCVAAAAATFTAGKSFARLMRKS